MNTDAKTIARLLKNLFDLNDLIACCDLGRRTDGRGNRAILRFGQLDGVGQGLFRNATSLHDMVNMELYKFSRMHRNPLSSDLDVINADVLALFEQNRDH